MKQLQEKSNIIQTTIADDSQLDVKFKDGKLIHMNIINQPIRSDFNLINFSNGELQLAAENTSLIEEIKILIRKLLS